MKWLQNQQGYAEIPVRMEPVRTSNHEPGTPLVVSVAMGYGHLRAAFAVADALDVTPQRADAEPLAAPAELAMWAKSRRRYERLTRASQLPWIGPLPRWLLDRLTDIAPFDPPVDRSRPDVATRHLDRLIRRGFGMTLAEHADVERRPVVSTFYAQALAHEQHGSTPCFCIVTDSDIHRIWAPCRPPRRITYLTPTRRAQRRLISYGVPEDRIVHTGFPLPSELLGGDALSIARSDLRLRLLRLDPTGRFHDRWGLEPPQSDDRSPKPPQLTAVVGGAGAQEPHLIELIEGLLPAIADHRLRLTVATGLHTAIASRLRQRTASHSFADRLRILSWSDFRTYYREFNQLLRTTDVLWTKPSEMVFYGALGIPLLLAPPVGQHEWYNRRWASEHGIAPAARSIPKIADWLPRWLSDGRLAAAAWSGFHTLPKRGVYRIADTVTATG